MDEALGDAQSLPRRARASRWRVRLVHLGLVAAGLTACTPPLLVRRSATIPLAPCDPREPATHERPRAIAGGDLDDDGHGDLRVRQPFAAELVVVADLGERRPRYYGAQPRPEDPPIHRVIIADDQRVAVLRDNPANLSWRWTIFELP